MYINIVVDSVLAVNALVGLSFIALVWEKYFPMSRAYF